MLISILLGLFPIAGLGHVLPRGDVLSRPYVKPTEPVHEIIALGDSFTSGVGADGVRERFGGVAGRGLRSYPMQMVKDLDMWETINGERKEPRLTFLAHHSDKTEDVIDLQLSTHGAFQKDSWHLARGVPFGRPQLALMTVGGNDAEVAYLLNDCIYRMWRPGDCHATIDWMVEFLKSKEYEERLSRTMLTVIQRGREARGANPPESFQLYVAEYPNMFNDKNTECDHIDWHFTWSFSSPAPLTTDLRKRFGHLNTLMNAAGKRAAEGLKDKGVIWVDDINRHFEGHRFCEYGKTSQQMDHEDTWFWTHLSDIGLEAKGDDSQLKGRHWGRRRGADTDVHKPWRRQVDDGIYGDALLDFVFQDQTLNESLLNSETPPWTWPGAEQYPDFESLLTAMQATVGDMENNNHVTLNKRISIPGLNGLVNPVGRLSDWAVRILDYLGGVSKWMGRKTRDILNYILPFAMCRTFHPKGAGYQVVKERMFAVIIQNREIAHRNQTITQHLTGPVIVV